MKVEQTTIAEALQHPMAHIRAQAQVLQREIEEYNEHQDRNEPPLAKEFFQRPVKAYEIVRPS